MPAGDHATLHALHARCMHAARTLHTRCMHLRAACMHVHCMHVHCMHCGQVGGHVKLRTLPQCYNCGEDTQFDWRACPYCFYTT